MPKIKGFNQTLKERRVVFVTLIVHDSLFVIRYIMFSCNLIVDQLTQGNTWRHSLFRAVIWPRPSCRCACRSSRPRLRAWDAQWTHRRGLRAIVALRAPPRRPPPWPTWRAFLLMPAGSSFVDREVRRDNNESEYGR